MVNGHNILQSVFEPLQRIDLVLFADGKERIDHCSPLCRFMASGEQIIFASQVMESLRLCKVQRNKQRAFAAIDYFMANEFA